MKDKVTGVVLALLALALFAALEVPHPHSESPQVGEEAPNFTFTVNERTQELRDLRGQVVVLNFWATWCPPCVFEMPSLERLHQKMSRRGLLVLGINLDEDPMAYDNFLRTHQISFPNQRDPEKRISTLYGTFMYPETYIIDPRGRLVRKVLGALEWDSPQMLEFLERLLAGQPG